MRKLPGFLHKLVFGEVKCHWKLHRIAHLRNFCTNFI